jgi:hypothetical protein
MKSTRVTETGAQLAGDAPVSPVLLVPAMIERRKSGRSNARIISRDMFIAIFIPVKETL